jgi:hypothetical protein
LTAVALLGLSVVGCATNDPSRTPGPGTFVANVGGGLVSVHDGIVKAVLGNAGRPMLIGAPAVKAAATEPQAEPTAAEPAPDTRQVQPEPVPAGVLIQARTADLNADGFVTLEEVVALGRSGLGDVEVVERLERTQQLFELTEEQEEFLRVRGISDDVIRQLRTMNRRPQRQHDLVSGPSAATDAKPAYDR